MTHFVDAFVDSGCLCFCAVSQAYAQRTHMSRIDIPKRELKLAQNQPETYAITQTASFELDVGGWSQEDWAYVIPDLSYDIILGKPWLEYNDITYHAKERTLTFGQWDLTLREKGWENGKNFRAQKEARPAIASLMQAVVRKARAAGCQKTAIFSTSLSEINKALQPKPKLSKQKIEEELPPELVSFWHLFLDGEDLGQSELPPHRPGLDHAIELQKDEQGREKPVPWGPLYGMSREELLVLLEKGSHIPHGQGMDPSELVFSRGARFICQEGQR